MSEEKEINNDLLSELVFKIADNFTEYDDVEEMVVISLRDLCENVHSEMAYIFLLEEKETESNYYTWCSSDYLNRCSSLAKLKISNFKWLLKEIKNKRVVFIDNTNKIPYEKEREVILKNDIDSILAAGIYAKEELRGILVLVNLDDSPELINQMERTIELTAKLIASAILRQEANQKIYEQNQKLRKAFNQVVQSENMHTVGQLAAGVAHEINTPIGFVSSNFQTLQEYFGIISDYIGTLKNNKEKLNEFETENDTEFILGDISELFSETKTGISRVVNIIKNLNVFSRIDVDKESIDYNINDALLSVVKLLKLGNQVKLSLDSDGIFQCRSSLINMAFLNLLRNSIEALDNVGKRELKEVLEIKTYDIDNDIFIEIKDQGKGIEKENLTSIFEPFFTTKELGKGPGLGLYITYDIIVKKYSGVIRIESENMNGTNVIIKLPKYEEN